jgi:hypothetical protein
MRQSNRVEDFIFDLFERMAFGPPAPEPPEPSYDFGRTYQRGRPPAGKKRAAGPWGVLHLAPGAPLDVAEAAYRALAKKAHPDAGGDPERFRRLTEAIEWIRKGK